MANLHLTSHIPFPAPQASLLVQMGQNALPSPICVMAMMIVVMALMNRCPSVCHHVQLTSLPVKMGQNVFLGQRFAMGTTMVVMTDHTTLPPSVTTVLLNICSGVKRTVLMFALEHLGCVMVKMIAMMALMNLPPCPVPLHVQLTSLPVRMG